MFTKPKFILPGLDQYAVLTCTPSTPLTRTSSAIKWNCKSNMTAKHFLSDQNLVFVFVVVVVDLFVFDF